MENRTTPNSINLGDYVRKNRLNKGYSQYFMANSLGISQNSYCLLENGQTKFNLERIIQIAEILEIEVQVFFTGFFTYLRHPG